MAEGRDEGLSRMARRMTGDRGRTDSSVASDQETAETGGAPRIRVAVIDDHPVLRHGIASLLGAEPDFEVVATGQTVEDARSLIDSEGIDVLVLDVRLGDGSGLHALGERKSDRPAVVVLTAFDYPQYAQAALEGGAAGFVLKGAPIEELFNAIRRAAAGGMTFAFRPAARVRLSPRELDVTRLVTEGRSNDEIGVALGIASKTVETHLRRLFSRLGIASRTELATRALREGWLDVPPTKTDQTAPT